MNILNSQKTPGLHSQQVILQKAQQVLKISFPSSSFSLFLSSKASSRVILPVQETLSVCVLLGAPLLFPLGQGFSDLSMYQNLQSVKAQDVWTSNPEFLSQFLEWVGALRIRICDTFPTDATLLTGNHSSKSTKVFAG